MHNHDDDLGPIGGIGSDNRQYGGRSRFARNRGLRSSHDAQIEAAFTGIKQEAAGQPLSIQQLARRLRIWVRDEYDVFLSESEATDEVEKRQGKTMQ